MTAPTTPSELAVPNSRGSVIAGIAFGIFILFFVVVAVHNLLDRAALIPSILWLLIVGGVIGAMWKTQGTRSFLINLLGACALRHFVWSRPGAHGTAEIQFGYRLFGHRFVKFGVPVNRIESVEWHTGQASSLAGRDMNDWQVALWYDHGEPVKSQEEQRTRKLDQGVHVVGPSRHKDLTVAFGHSVLEFLRRAGADLVQSEDECTFVRKATNSQTE